jgi:hypothetical protein
MRRGDVALMYGTKRLQSYVAVARACCDPRQNDRAQRLKKNRQWWVYLQVQPFQSPIARADVESRGFAQGAGSGLKTPAGSRANAVSATAVDGFGELLREHDPKAAGRLDAWLSGRGRYPVELDLDELRRADWEQPTTSSPEELALSRRIAAHLARSKNFRYLTHEDVVATHVARKDVDLSFEHPIRDLIGRGRVDIVMVDLRRDAPTLLAIEVKIRASLAPSRNPIPQIVRYRDALTAKYAPAWRIETLVVAEHFHEDVIREADQKGLAYRICAPNTGRLKAPL